MRADVKISGNALTLDVAQKKGGVYKLGADGE